MVIGKKTQMEKLVAAEEAAQSNGTGDVKPKKLFRPPHAKPRPETSLETPLVAATPPVKKSDQASTTPIRVRLSADIEQSLHVQLKICSAVTGESINKIIQDLIRLHCPANVAA